jgi:Icc-related predicted phosphoesterase
VTLFKRSTRKRMRIFFTTDIHGSDRCFRKFLAAKETYEADVLLLGGDVVGKAITPIEHLTDGRYRYTLFGEEHAIPAGELSRAKAEINFNGFYPAVLTAEELERLSDDAEARTELFRSLIVAQMHSWDRLVEERLDETTRCILTPGNDDPLVIDEVFKASTRVEFTEGRAVQVGPVWLASLGNTNRTPWNTEREFEEDELLEQIRAMVDPVADGRPLVFNFHCPPYDSGLDTVQALDDDLRPVVRNNAIVEVPAGSTAVRDAIEQYAPVAGLHGHIHEAQGMRIVGTTRCFNPGSDYSAGVLKGLLVDFDEDGNIAGHLFTTG